MKKMLGALWFALLAVALVAQTPAPFSLPVRGKVPITGAKRLVQVRKVHDADTYQVCNCLVVRDTLRYCDEFKYAYWVRVEGIDGPELYWPMVMPKAQPYGVEAGNAARNLIREVGGYVTVDSVGFYELPNERENGKPLKRVLARIQLPDGSDYGTYAVANGLAWRYFPHYPNNPPADLQRYSTLLRNLQRSAREQDLGLWGMKYTKDKPLLHPATWKDRFGLYGNSEDNKEKSGRRRGLFLKRDRD